MLRAYRTIHFEGSFTATGRFLSVIERQETEVTRLGAIIL